MEPRKFQTLLIALLLALGCVTNPVTGKSELRLMSAQQEIQLGLQNYGPMQQAEGGVYDLDPALNQHVTDVGRRLAVVSDSKLPYEFVVFNNSIPNAWALPGGKLAINRGLLTELRSESELAAVLGHEIVHAAVGHSAQAATRGMLFQGALVAARVAEHDRDYGNIAMLGAGLGAQLVNQRYSRKALAERNVSLARAKAREAIKLEPREGHFYALRGDAYFMDERYRDASRDYSSAISRQADFFFYYYLQRGLAPEKTRSDSSAKRDLERGIELLPTGPAYLGLGNIAKRSVRLDEAKKLYATASQAPGGTGQAAQAELMRIDFPDNPEKYLGKRVGLDDRGRVLVQIDNPTSVLATDIELVVRYRDGNGGVRQVSRSIDGTLAAGRSSRVALGLGPFSSTDEFRVDISSARIAEASKRR